jgi:hypothetical protein
MAERALKCPQCTGPLAPSRFGRSLVCTYCGSTVVLDEQMVPAARFREALRAWNSPTTHGYASWITVDGGHWALGPLLARGEISDVYPAERARRPTERVLVKILREAAEAARFDHEWEVLTELQRSAAPGAPTFAPLLPQPVARGTVAAGAFAGAKAMVLRRDPGFVHTFEAVRRALPGGIEPRASVWIWRRILEVLSFLHACGYVHGAVLPPHLLAERAEHGVRLVGYGAAGRPGERLAVVSPAQREIYPPDLLASRRLAPAADLAMSARAVTVLVGGDPATGEVPDAVPPALVALLRRVGSPPAGAAPGEDAWALREHLGEIARRAFGPPAFCPLVLPES